MFSALDDAINSVPPGAWAVGVSGGADSVALLHLLHARLDLSLHIVHLNHETRGEESDADATFVVAVAKRLNVPCTIARLHEIQPQVRDLPKNPSARYRRVRQWLFGSVVREHQLSGVLLAHHADDQAETVLLRLLRGSGWSGLCGMQTRTVLADIEYRRPLLGVHSQSLRDYLQQIGEYWREDSSNRSLHYRRNALRPILRNHPTMRDALLDLSHHCSRLREWTHKHAPILPESIELAKIQPMSRLLMRAAVSRWLRDRDVPADEISAEVLDRVIMMIEDAASPSHLNLPGAIRLHRRRGTITASSPLGSPPAR
ncbi:MAG: tRNA lysidine(34) synthetase TilS [Phycisphaerae bacterium]|nr:tRNA lysidine(34) synthetase TilS [Phycisphaerae bacterium]